MKIYNMNTNKKFAAAVIFVTYLILLVCALLFIASSKAYGQTPLFTLQLNDTKNNNDETVVYYQDGATSGFDFYYDACKFHTPGNALYIAQESAAGPIKINAVQSDANFSIPILTTAQHTGACTISVQDFFLIPAGTCFKLYDKFTGVTADLLDTSYTFTLSDTTTVARFILSVNYSSLTVTTKPINPPCTNSKNAKFIVAGENEGPWNYIWKNEAGSVLKTSLNKNCADTLSAMGSGHFSVDVKTTGGCGFVSTSFFIKPYAFAAFTCADTILLNSGGELTTINSSRNEVNYKWDFGDGSQPSGNFNADHFYYEEGNYEVKLIASDNASCTDTVKKMITVINKAVTRENIQWCSIGKNQYAIRYKGNDPMKVEVYNTQGKRIFAGNNLNQNTNRENINFDFNDMEKAIYILKCENKTNSKEIRFMVE